MSMDIARLTIGLIVTALSALVTMYIIPWAKEKIGTERFEELLAFAEYAVRAAEQLYQDNGEKKQYVYNFLLKKAEALGLEFSATDIDLLVEGVVHEVKKG